jgi:hypothetical protein
VRTRRPIETVAFSAAIALCAAKVEAGGSPARPAIEVTVIQAMRTDGGASMDPQLTDLPRHSREEPFVRFNTFKLLDRRELPIQVGKPVTDALGNGRTLAVTLLDATDSAGQKRFHLRAGIDEPGKQALLKLLEVTAGANEPFFVAGQAFRGGTLFVEIVVRP